MTSLEEQVRAIRHVLNILLSEHGKLPLDEPDTPQPRPKRPAGGEAHG